MIIIVSDSYKRSVNFLHSRGMPYVPSRVGCLRPDELFERLGGCEFLTVVSLVPLTKEERSFVTARRCLLVEVTE